MKNTLKVNGVAIRACKVLVWASLVKLEVGENNSTLVNVADAELLLKTFTGGKTVENQRGIVFSLYPNTFSILWRDASGGFWQYIGKAPKTESFAVPSNAFA